MSRIAKHPIALPDKVQVTMNRGDKVSMLEIDIELPHGAMAVRA